MKTTLVMDHLDQVIASVMDNLEVRETDRAGPRRAVVLAAHPPLQDDGQQDRRGRCWC